MASLIMKYFSIVLSILTFVFSLTAQTQPDEKALTGLLNEFLAGAGRNDAEVHDRFWAEDLIYTRSAGVRINKEALMKGVRSAPAAKPDDAVTIYSADDVRIQQYGNAAVVAFKLVGNTTKADGTKTVSNHLNTGTFIKRKGKWQVVAWQATTIPKAEPAAKTVSASKSGEPKPVTLTGSPAAKTDSTESRTYLRGPRGGCYYLNSSGKKTYVDHGLCK